MAHRLSPKDDTMRYFLFLFGLICFSACSVEQQLERREDRILGTWVIDRARFDENGDLFNDNVDDLYKGDLIDFYADGTTNYESINNDLFVGLWRITPWREEVNGEGDVEFILDAEFYFPNGDLAFAWVGEINRLGNNDFNLSISEPTGVLRLRLDRVQ